jgi:di/tricarboxylate transporter
VTPEIATTLVILVVAVLLFVTDRVRIDLVALVVMVALALTQLVTPSEALSGFSNLAVITVWAVLILSAGLSKTGVASVVGQLVLRLAGRSEVRLLAIIMIVAGVLSSFMNNIGVAAMLMPVVINIARRIGRPPSKLLMPLAFASLLGGMTTLIGTPPNILVSEAMQNMGIEPFRMFDFAPFGMVVMLVGVAYLVLFGRHLLPNRDIAKESARLDTSDLGDVYDLSERLFRVKLPASSLLDGKTLAKSRLGSALGLNVFAILRDGNTRLAPDPETVLRSGDGLLVGGRLDQLNGLRGHRHLLLQNDHVTTEWLTSDDISIVEAKLSRDSSLIGKTLIESDFRHRFSINVLGIYRNGTPFLANIQDITLAEGDILLVQGARDDLEKQVRSNNVEVLSPISRDELARSYHLNERLLTLRVPKDSVLVGRTLEESRLGDAFGLDVLGVIREGKTHLMPGPQEPLLAEDLLLVEGDPEDLQILRGLQKLVIDTHADVELNDYESDRVGVAEVVLSPHSTLSGKNLRELHFREKYSLSVLAIWRGGRPYRSGLRDMALRFGDALLLYGPRNKIKVLGSEPDFLVLTEEAQEAPRLKKAPLALIIMGIVLCTVLLDWLPISIAAVMGMVLMILTGCLTMEEAYRAIEWKAIFLIAGMLPLGIAMGRTGAARFLAERMVALMGGAGPLGVLSGIFILTALLAQFVPNAAVTVLVAPIAYSVSKSLGVSPYPLLMTVAIASSASFLSPVGHPSFIIIMGPGGYRFRDYFKVGLPLTIVILVVVVFVLPVFWPF